MYGWPNSPLLYLKSTLIPCVCMIQLYYMLAVLPSTPRIELIKSIDVCVHICFLFFLAGSPNKYSCDVVKKEHADMLSLLIT